MKLRSLMMAIAVAATGMTSALVTTSAQAQAKEQFFPVLPYRTGAYAPNGVPWANGYADYLKLINARDGGTDAAFAMAPNISDVSVVPTSQTAFTGDVSEALSAEGTLRVDPTMPIGVKSLNVSYGVPFTVSGLVAGDTLNSIVQTASGGTAALDNVGNYSITPSGGAGGSFNASNYVIAYRNGTLTVTPLAVSLSGTKNFDGTSTLTVGATGSSLNVSNSVAGAPVNVTGSALLTAKTSPTSRIPAFAA